MSVVLLGAEELGLFVAVAVKQQILEFSDAMNMAVVITNGNAAAYEASYGGFEWPALRCDIEKVALDRLAKSNFSGSLGCPMYSMVDQHGVFHFQVAKFSPAEQEKVAFQVVTHPLREAVEKVEEWMRREAIRVERAAEDAVAFNEVAQLPVKSSDELKAMMAENGASRLIVAEFKVDESDSQSDYYGGRSARHVVIGFGTGSRESFSQMRKAAANFPPTAEYAPGRDRFLLGLVWDHNWEDDLDRAWVSWSGNGYDSRPMKGCGVPFSYYASDYVDEPDVLSRGFRFSTQAEVDAFIAEHAPKQGTEWNVTVDSYEHRENYSMGGGNYLGTNRYSGWKVYQTNWFSREFEYFEAPKVEKPAKKARVKKSPSKSLISGVSRMAMEYAQNV